MRPLALEDVVKGLGAFDAEATIYAVAPWSANSLAIVAIEPEEGGLPADAKAIGAKYFLEVLIARDDVLGSNGWSETALSEVIYYAENDAFLPKEFKNASYPDADGSDPKGK